MRTYLVENLDIVIEQIPSLPPEPLVDAGQIHARGSRIFVPNGWIDDNSMALFRRQHEFVGRTFYVSVPAVLFQFLEDVGDILEAHQQIVDQLGIACLVNDFPENPGCDQRLDDQSFPSWAFGIEHQEIAENSGDLVAVEVIPG